jgi:CheY-like chemotaxis protein
MAAKSNAERWPIRVLYYDDNRDLARIVQLYLNDYHCSVRTSSRLRDAREALANERFDVAVIDWVTADRSGPELLKLLRESAPETRRIVYSAHETADAESTANGAEEFVRKGADSEPLRLAIERAVFRNRESQVAPPPLPLWINMFRAQFEQISQWCDRPLLGVMTPGGIVPDSLANAIIYCWREQVPNVMFSGNRCQLWSALECEIHLMGQVVLGQLPQVERGILDRAEGVRFVLDRAELMPTIGQQSLSDAVRRQSIRRVGSDCEIPTEITGIVVFEPGQEKKLFRPLRLALQDATVHLNCGSSKPDTLISDWINSLSEHKIEVSPGLRAAMHSLHTVLTLHDADHIAQTKPFWEMFAVLQCEHLGLSILERSMATTAGMNSNWPSLKEAEQMARTYYVCRLLGETSGNITEAAELAQVSRQTLHNLIRDNQIDLSQFD